MSDDGREISLSDLAPERLTFYDNAYGGDGTRHEWRMYADLGLEDLGALRRIQEDLARASALLAKAEASPEELEAAAQRLGAGLDAFLRLLLPTLPLERLRAIPLRGRERLLTWWQAKQPADAVEGLSLPLGRAGGRPTAPSRPSAGSSPPTA